LKIKRTLRRLGCGLLLMLWFLLLLTPCLFIVLITQHEIVLAHSDIPEDDLRVWLIQEADQRGFAISNSRRVSAPNDEVCTLTDVRFFLWKGKGDPNHYCSCYVRRADRWSSVAEGDEACKLAGE